MAKSKILRHENQLASQANEEVLHDSLNLLRDIAIILDREVEIRQEVRDEVEGFVDWSRLQFASNCIEMGQLLLEEEFGTFLKGQPHRVAILNQSLATLLDYVQEGCEVFGPELREKNAEYDSL